jgi:hypothetical protein
VRQLAPFLLEKVQYDIDYERMYTCFMLLTRLLGVCHWDASSSHAIARVSLPVLELCRRPAGHVTGSSTLRWFNLPCIWWWAREKETASGVHRTASRKDILESVQDLDL